MLANSSWHLKPIGFIDNADMAEGSLLGIRIVGKADDLDEVLVRLRVDEVVFSGDPIEPALRQQALGACAERKIAVRDLIFEMREAGRSVHGSVA